MTHGCTGPCNQGRSNCPTPRACELPDNDQTESADAEVLRVVLIIIAVICAACLVLHLAVNVIQATPAIG